MIVQEFIDKLTQYIASSPENAHAQVALKFEDSCYSIDVAVDAKGMPGLHLLVLVPNYNDKLPMKELKIQ